MNTLEMRTIGVQELNLNEMLEIEGGKRFWDTFCGKLVSAFCMAFVAALGAALADEVI
ncbi:MAG: hypothetical protein HOP37_02835 [Cyclobacteriaceae bacterium]|nr:hypothetical protein [Cyclobacteriaceae bacterium]